MKPMTRLKQIARNTRTFFFALAAAVGISSLSHAGEGTDQDLTLDHPQVRAVIGIQDLITPEVMREPGILGTAVGLEGSQPPALVIFVDRDHPGVGQLVRSLPAEIKGMGLRVHLTDKFRAFAGNTAKQTPPIQLGTSGGWTYDLANGYCCGGTLGSLIKVNGSRYILSNYHVMERDIVPGGNGIVVNPGDPIVQPGLMDVGCASANTQVVGTVLKLNALPNSNVDAAIALVSPGMVNTNGSILGIGTISATTLAAKLKQAVKKSGRSTGLTTSTVTGLNATVSVAYESECMGATAFTKTFTGQIVVANSNSSFLGSGESGSLLVENVTTKPRAIGLLFAGTSTTAIANPIGQVLQFVGSKLGGTATMVGN